MKDVDLVDKIWLAMKKNKKVNSIAKLAAAISDDQHSILPDSLRKRFRNIHSFQDWEIERICRVLNITITFGS